MYIQVNEIRSQKVLKKVFNEWRKVKQRKLKLFKLLVKKKVKI
jgi:hypothetical protein